jgi:uncharacterized FAD-dependent dehydrogenase
MNRTKVKCDRLISSTVTLPYQVNCSEAYAIVKKKLSRALKTNLSNVNFSIYKKSIDARHKDDIRFAYTVLVEFEDKIWIDEANLSKEGFRICPKKDINIEFGEEKSKYPPIVVGSGPAGMFCALLLAENGYRPVLIERGDDLQNRVSAVNSFFEGNSLNTESNVMFGAGGAGTFSDGKLVTRISDPLCAYVFERFCDFGAPSEITYKAKPHIGTDLLQGIVSKILMRISECGGRVIYNCRLDSFTEYSDGSVSAHTSQGDIIGSSIVLAIGHSARDTYKYLNANNYSLIAKPFSVGVRIEHLRADIERALYGSAAGDPLLGAAEYALSDTSSGRGVYTFCMCPGGEVIAAASEEGGVVVNGMSHHARDLTNSNAAVAVSVMPDDYDGTPMGAIEFQRCLERKAFALGGGNYTAPIELLGDYLESKKNGLRSPSTVKPSYTRSMTSVVDLSDVFPDFINNELKRGFKAFGKKMQGFDSPDAVMTAVESRTSSPIRILRNELGVALGHSSVYPCGEGAGYAGGITSAAVDGIKTALNIMKRFAP